MGSVISKAANGVGGVLGNAFAAPFKTVFGGSCEGVCSGAWDLVCFLEHLCVSNLVKLFMILILCYMILLFFYLLFKVGICQCITRSLCKMCCAACEAYWFALGDITCFLCHKLMNTKRVNRRRYRHFRDMEVGYNGSSDENVTQENHYYNVRKRKSIRHGRSPLSRHGSGSFHRRRRRIRSKAVDMKGRSQRQRSSRRVQLSTVRKGVGEARMFKRQRLIR